MSSGVFKLITSSGPQDKIIYAQEFLKERILRNIKEKNPKITTNDLLTLPNDGYLNVDGSVLPSLNEIERSHNTFINNTYKPCVPIASEYIKVSHNAPKFGDTLEYMLPQVGQFINDTVVHVRIKGLSAKNPKDRVRYVAMLGHKLFQNVQFTVNSTNIIDEYTSDDYNSYYQFEVPDSKKTGWLRNIGQEIPNLGYITSDPSYDMHREYRWIGDGNQTLKYKHDTIDLFIPLLFWFREVKNSLPSCIIPWGQTQIKVKLAEINEIVGFADYGGGGAYNDPKIEFCDLYINNLFTLPEIFNIFSKKFLFTIIRVHRHHKEPLKVNSGNQQKILLNNLKWPTESLYFSFKPRANLALTQYWYKNCKLVEKSFKVPVVAKDESLTTTGNIISASIGKAILPGALSAVDGFYNNYDFIITGGSGYNSDDITKNRYIITTYNGTSKEITIDSWSGVIPNSSTTFELFTPQLAINLVSYYKELPVVDNISLESSGIEIFKFNSEMFFNSYLSSKYKNMNTPEDRGLYFLNFNTHPLISQPSGSLNVSINRELYLNFTSNEISKDYPVDLIVLARAINFLLVDAGSLTLKFST